MDGLVTIYHHTCISSSRTSRDRERETQPHAFNDLCAKATGILGKDIMINKYHSVSLKNHCPRPNMKNFGCHFILTLIQKFGMVYKYVQYLKF